MIGIFDSGSGGLTVLQALKRRVPDADVTYFGDIRNAPYGSRTPHDLIRLTEAGIHTLQRCGATEIIVACSSVAPSVLAGVAEHSRLIDMTRPTARAMRKHAGKRVLLVATPATVASRLYADALEVIVQLDELPIAGLASAIEFGAPVPEVESIVRDAFQKREKQTYDQILLGCTHYPLVKDVIEKEARNFFGAIECIDPAEAVAEESAERFDARGSGIVTFRISKDSSHFRNRVQELFPDAQHAIDVI